MEVEELPGRSKVVGIWTKFPAGFFQNMARISITFREKQHNC